MSTQDQQIAVLTDKLNALENESRRILRALQWSTKVRMILFFGLLLFVLISSFLFYRLYNDIKTRRLEEVQRLIAEQPAEFSEPLTRQIMALAEQEGPFVAEAFREQAQEDSQLYVAAFDEERTTLINNLQSQLETKMTASYATMLNEQEQMLKEEFPELEDPEKMQNIRDNMEKIYDKLSKRYYVEFLKDELEDIAVSLDGFPKSEPNDENIPVGEQIATEFLELVRMMLVNSDHYVIPPEAEVGTRTRVRRPAVKDDSDDNLDEAESEDDAELDDN
jgi:signal transduction histidine kinase